MKKLVIALLLVVASAAFAGKSTGPAPTLMSDCSICAVGQTIHFTGSNYPAPNGGEEYGACMQTPNGGFCYPIAAPVGGNIEFTYSSVLPGSYHVDVILARKGPDTFFNGTNFLIE